MYIIRRLNLMESGGNAINVKFISVTNDQGSDN